MIIEDSTLESLEEFKYLGTTLAYQNSTQEEFNAPLVSGIACFHSV
jgi:hypothetical protein